MIPSAPVVRAVIALARVVPVGVLRALARGIAAVGCLAAPARCATLTSNVAHLVPNVPPRERRRLAKRTLQNLFDAAVDLCRLPSASRAEVLALARIEGREHLDAALHRGVGVIVVTPHLGPYELGGAWLACAGYPVHAMVEEIDPATNAAMARYREATGMQLVPRGAGVRALLRLLQGGAIVLLVADRVVGDGSDGLLVPFGDGTRMVPTGPAALALTTGAPILVGTIVREAGGAGAHRYLIRLEPPIDATSFPDGPPNRERLTRRVAERLAAAVQAHPDQWFVFQPEWTLTPQRA